MKEIRTLTLAEATTEAGEIATSIMEGLGNDMPDAYGRVFSQSLAILMENNTIIAQEESGAESPQGQSVQWSW